MRVLLAGGGSGGHVTPLKAIYDQLKTQVPAESLSVKVITDRGFYSRAQTIFETDTTVVIGRIYSGKYRRYESKSMLWHILHLPTLLKNIRDIFLLAVGLVQSMIEFIIRKPDVVFCKGGFVCVPIGLCAHVFRVPLIIHDSDTRPGLTNRLLSRWAQRIATGMPASFYPYKKDIMSYTGIPVKADFQPVSTKLQTDLKQQLRLDPKRRLLLVTGGGNGALTLNKHIAAAAKALLTEGWSIVQLAGSGKTATCKKVRSQLPQALQQHWMIEEFAEMTPRLLAADLVIARTSASTIQECANAQKIMIGVPSPHLDDQKQNAAHFASLNAIVAVDETQLAKDGSDIVKIVGESSARTELAEELHQHFARPNAAKELAHMITQATS